ncbi:GIY-YIG nuclease family protein [Planctomicrobium sp. SH661]|uniref:GIY-YIG nuclease family protein n=1 Tax=Planctomicrobium sp. SH661 TaxID=3448124 RepID=UPI003F5C1D34
MKFWDDSLRVCSKCRKKITLDGVERKACPHCGNVVWFFDYRKLPEPPPIPGVPASGFFGHPTSNLLLAILCVLSLLALVSFSNSLMVPMVCALIAVGMGIYGMMRHAEAIEVERQLVHYTKVLELARAFRSQTAELTERYHSLLATGNSRVEEYYRKIYEAAEQEKRAAQESLNAARADRLAVASVEQRIDAIAARLVADHLKWMTNRLTADPENYQRRKNELTKTFEFVEAVGYAISPTAQKAAIADLKNAFQTKVREQQLREEQRRMKQQMREELRLQREHEEAIRDAEEKEAELADRLKEALASQAGIHSREIEELQQQLAEAQAKAERAKSLAQLTKVGHVYILSNIGSFGENVFKVGMTRREDPQHRVRELGDASVPFPFDVHAMISCDNAPALENALHRELTRHRVNRVNLRKEYFKIELKTILQAVRQHHGVIEYVAEPEALEYRDSQNVSPDELVELTEELAEMGVTLDEDDEFEPQMESV